MILLVSTNRGEKEYERLIQKPIIMVICRWCSRYSSGSKFVKSDCARNATVKSVATGMQIKDEALATYDTIVEDAKDIYAEAKSKKEAK